MARRGSLLASAQQKRGTPAGPTAMFTETFANLNRWNSCQWNSGGTIRNGPGSAYTANNEYSCTIVAIDGRTDVLRFELRNGDIPFSTTERAEIGEPFMSTLGDLQVTTGDERWICWDMKFDTTWPIAISWCLVWQWHHNGATGSPPLTLLSGEDNPDNVYISNDNEVIERLVAPVARNTWQRWIVHAKFSADPAVGFIHVYVDGVEKLAKTFQRTMVVGDSGNYFKTGIYRDPAHTATMIRYVDNFSIWNVLPPELGG